MEQKILIPIKASKGKPPRNTNYENYSIMVLVNTGGVYMDALYDYKNNEWRCYDGCLILPEIWYKPVSIDELLPSKGENSIIENICYSSIIKDDDLDADTIEEGVKLGIKQGIKFYINHIKSKLTEKGE